MEREVSCHCGATVNQYCPDCQAPLCADHRCSACQRCADHCFCSMQWWTPDLFGMSLF